MSKTESKPRLSDNAYMLYIQSCAKFWNDPAFRTLKQQLTNATAPYQFLGICATMWRFLKPSQRKMWADSANSKVSPDKLKQHVASLAKQTLEILKT
jgi:hypothetical protein